MQRVERDVILLDDINTNSYLGIAIGDLRAAKKLYELGEFNKAVVLAYSYLGNILKNTLWAAHQISGFSQTLEVRELLASRRIVELFNYVSSLLKVEFTVESYKGFTNLEELYENLTQPGPSYVNLDLKSSKYYIELAVKLGQMVLKEEISHTDKLIDSFSSSPAINEERLKKLKVFGEVEGT